MEFVGVLVNKINEREGTNANGPWKIGTYLLQTVEMYPKRMAVDVGDGQMGRIAQWDSMIGKNVTIQFEIDAHEYNGRWFNSLRAWQIKENTPKTTTASTATAQPQPGPQAEQPKPEAPATVDPVGASEGNADDLPF